MADYGLGFLGQYITAAELVGHEPTLTIDRVELEKVESMKDDDDEKGKPKLRDRWVIYFRASKSGRGWLVNRTNAEAIKAMWGRETNAWCGKRITLMTQQVRVGRKMEPGIRVKGSPELTEPLTFELKLPRKRGIPTTLLPTGKPAAPKPDAPADPAPAADPTLAQMTDDAPY
jgi:hypothetical protein